MVIDFEKALERLYIKSIWGSTIFFLPFFQGFISNLTIQRQYFPNDEDQVGAAKALLRLQDTYNLDTDTISKGNLPGKYSSLSNAYCLAALFSPLGKC
jgi:prolyl 4-hydroxylase